MLKEREIIVRRATILFDMLIITLSFFLAFYIRQHFRIFYNLDLLPSKDVIKIANSSLENYAALLIIIVPLWGSMLYLNGMYRSMRTRNLFEILWIVIKSSFCSILIFGFIVFLFKIEFFSRLFFIIFAFFSTTLILTEKCVAYSIMRRMRKKGYNYRSLLIVGTGKRAATFIEKIKGHPEWGLKIVGVIDDEPGRGIEGVDNINVIGSIEDLPQIFKENAIDEVIFVVPRSRLSCLENAIIACEMIGIKATVAVDLFDLKLARAHSTEIDGIPLVTFSTTNAKEWQLFIKRMIDIILSTTGIVLISPILLIAAVLIKMTSSGPILFRQERLGQNGRRFILFKFRTMYQGAHEVLSKVEDPSEMDGRDFRVKKIKWITPVGRILRKFSIDELPQLFNVFIGHMSLIGPRPTVPDEVDKYKFWQRRRFTMRPGITCLWQIKGRNKIGFEEWMKLDLEYLDNWSLWLDFKILIKTIPVVMFGIGAY
jgi:exopolysaccharide biosynthesis polyprenyl glycosylphosphotransferase